jgi:hypothetical protein
LAKAARTPFWVMKNGRMVNPNAKGCCEMLLAAMGVGKETKEPGARAKKAKKGGLKRVLDKAPNRPPVSGDERE